MPLSTAQSLGWSLARTMMTVIILIETNAGYSVMPLDEFDGDPNVVEVYIGYLRRKIDAPFDTALIHTVRGAGYRLGAGE